MFDQHFLRIESVLTELGLVSNFYIMTSSEWTVTTETVRAFPSRMLESGPATGVLMSAFHGATLTLSELLFVDREGRRPWARWSRAESRSRRRK